MSDSPVPRRLSGLWWRKIGSISGLGMSSFSWIGRGRSGDIRSLRDPGIIVVVMGVILFGGLKHPFR